MGKLSDDTLKLNIDINGSKAKKELAGLEQSTRDLTEANKGLKTELQKLEAQNKKGTAEYKNIQNQIKANNATIKTNKTEMESLRKQIGITSLTTKQLGQEQRRLKNLMANITPYTKEWKEYEKQLKAVNKRQIELKGGSPKAGKAMGLLKSALPILSVGVLVGVLKSAVSELFNLTRQMQGDAVRSSTVFGNQLGYVQEQSAKVAEQMGLTNREFVANAAATADLLIPLDFTREASAKMSVELQKLTGALDEWTGGSIGAKEVSNILTKAMLGENEQLKTLGIAIRKDSDEFRNLVKEKLKATGVTKAQAEAMATLELITKKSADAQVAYNREGNQLLRLQKSMSVWWKNLKEGVVEWLSVSPVEELKNEQTEVNSLVVKLQSANVSEEVRAKLLERLKTLAPDVASAIQSETTNVNAVTKALDKYNSQMALKILLKEKEIEQENQSEEVRNRQQALAKSESEMAKDLAKVRKSVRESNSEYANDIEKIWNDTNKTIEEKSIAIWQLGIEAGADGTRSLARSTQAYQIQAKHLNAGTVTLEETIKKAKSLTDEYKNLFGVDPDQGNEEKPENPDPTSTETPNADSKVPKQLKPIALKEEDIEAEMEKANDKIIEEYLKGQDKLKEIQEKYGLANAATVNEQAISEIKKLRDEKLITEKEFQEAKAAIEEDSIQQSIERQLQYRMLQEDSRLLELEEEEFNYQERLVKEDERYQAALEIEDERYAIEIERAKGQKDQLLQLENQHKQNLINVENTYTQRKQDVISRQNAIENGRLQIASAVSDGIIQVLGEESSIGKAMLMVKQGLALAGATIDLTSGLSATAAVGFPQNVPLIAAFIGQTAGFIATIKNATKSTENLGSKKEGGYAETSSSDNDAVGIYHANEFIGNADSVRNPTVKMVYDIIDVAQKNGTISMLDLPKALTSQVPGKKSGGYANENNQTPQSIQMSPEVIQALNRNSAIMEKLENGGIKSYMLWDHYKEGKQKMEALESDVGLTNN